MLCVDVVRCCCQHNPSLLCSLRHCTFFLNRLVMLQTWVLLLLSPSSCHLWHKKGSHFVWGLRRIFSSFFLCQPLAPRSFDSVVACCLILPPWWPTQRHINAMHLTEQSTGFITCRPSQCTVQRPTVCHSLPSQKFSTSEQKDWLFEHCCTLQVAFSSILPHQPLAA